MSNIFRRTPKKTKSTGTAGKRPGSGRSPGDGKKLVRRRKRPPEQAAEVAVEVQEQKPEVEAKPAVRRRKAPIVVPVPEEVLEVAETQPSTEPVEQPSAPAAEAPPAEAVTTEAVETPAGAKEPAAESGLKKKGSFPKLGKAVIALPPHYKPGATPPRRPSTTGTTTPGQTQEDRWKAVPGKERPARAWETEKEKAAKAKKAKRKNRGSHQRIEMRMDDLPSPSARRRRSKNKGSKRPSPKAKAIKRRVFVDSSITVANLAHGMSVKGTVLIKKLLGLGQPVTLNDVVDFETAQMLGEEFDYEVVNTTFNEGEYLIENQPVEQDGDPRPPVVTIMGHVDHGKTTLLDSIRRSKVAAGEAGGITQHLSAYQVDRDGQLITFIDTPGHQAFTAMRERGAKVTDIVVLVVAADDGVMPQTVEALNHARAAGVQLLVAVNKCDLPGAKPERVMQELMQHDLIPEEYGGDAICVKISALKAEGLDDLLDNILLLSEMGEFKAKQDRNAEGRVLEARLEKGRGPVATVLVKKGTLKRGDSLVLGNVWGRVRAMNDFRGKNIKEALPSAPVEIIGLQEVPTAGDDFVVVKTDKDARTLVAHRLHEAKLANQTRPKKLSLEDLLEQQKLGEIVNLKLIIKSDVGGTLEAMKNSLDKIDVPGTNIKILHSAVGAITESDIVLASTNEGIVLGFNIRPDAQARRAMNERQVDVRTYKVIYEALEDIEKALKGMLAPETREVVHGHAEIKQTFVVPKVGTIAGCFVSDGKISRAHKIRLLRQGSIIWEGRLASLQRFKDPVREVEKGYECGMNLDGFNDIKVGDELEGYSVEDVVVED
jgi:translation initiation factor IF-2